ncbi:GntR family transcriptional regulator [Enterovirga rhinocerotis]|uniref:DNA-binding GntR family transcriptional regulator n=1 Tax=Enterovirga rhinocerotis TaxID=1339210 RepID=A0A4R7BX02_9HYPH|nr:GntR family transcriptional regulator [Enterovirga rhinocerotis]TDR90424.1 DNA-binding GntR family transcriptional regulator [Enterovirga rhinocerotis]
MLPMLGAAGITLDRTAGQLGPRTLASAICERIRAEIIAADLMPGQKLNISLLAKRFSVSLAAVREALSRLVSDGLVEALDQKGFRVRAVSPRDLLDLTRTRIEIEGLALRHSIEQGGPAWEAEVRAAHERLLALPRLDPIGEPRCSDAWAREHRLFHEALVGACDSSWLLAFRTILHEQSERYRRLSTPLAPSERDVEGEHRRIVEAVLARDVEATLRAIADHFQRTTDIILAATPVLLGDALAA